MRQAAIARSDYPIEEREATAETTFSTWRLTVHDLARAVFPYGTRKRVIAMFRAYFDESGTHARSPVVAVAGFLAPDIQWERFEQEWAKFLAREQIPFFHMTDYENRQSYFKDWENDRRKTVIQKIVNLINRRVTIPIIATVGVADYREVKLWERFQGAPHNPYAFCILMCLQIIAAWAEKVGHQERIAYVCEQGAAHVGELSVVMKHIVQSEERQQRYRWGGLTFADKKRFTPLQAADFIAYEAYKEAQHFVSKRPGRPPRTSTKIFLQKWQRLFSGPTPYLRFYRKQDLLSSRLVQGAMEGSLIRTTDDTAQRIKRNEEE